MKPFKNAVGFVAMVLVVLGLSRSAEAGGGLPFKGKFEGFRESSVPLERPFVMNTVVCTGSATQLGLFDATFTLVVNTEEMNSVGEIEFVAADGDLLTVEFVGYAMPTETPGVVSIVEEGTVTGGTGRFADATGNIVCRRLFDLPNGLTVGTLEGTISSPGAN